MISLVGPLYFGLSCKFSNSHESSSRRSRLGDRWPMLLSKLCPTYLFFYFDIDLYFLELSCLLWVTSGIDSRFKDFCLGITFVKSLVLRHLSSKLSSLATSAFAGSFSFPNFFTINYLYFFIKFLELVLRFLGLLLLRVLYILYSNFSRSSLSMRFFVAAWSTGLLNLL